MKKSIGRKCPPLGSKWVLELRSSHRTRNHREWVCIDDGCRNRREWVHNGIGSQNHREWVGFVVISSDDFETVANGFVKVRVMVISDSWVCRYRRQFEISLSATIGFLQIGNGWLLLVTGLVWENSRRVSLVGIYIYFLDRNELGFFRWVLKWG